MRERARVCLAFVAWLGAASTSAAGGDAPAPARQVPASPPAAGAASADCANALADRVQARYDRMRDLAARFTQRTTGPLQGGELARGSVVLAKPGRMRWSYEAPEPSLVVSDGATLWIYDPAAREVQELQAGAAFLSGAAIQFLLGSGRLRESFHLAAQRCGEPSARLVLTPKQDATYQRLELEVDARTGEIRVTSVLDLFDNRTEIELLDPRYDLAPDASMFRFVPEPGVRVLRVDPPAS